MCRHGPAEYAEADYPVVVKARMTDCRASGVSSVHSGQPASRGERSGDEGECALTLSAFTHNDADCMGRL